MAPALCMTSRRCASWTRGVCGLRWLLALCALAALGCSESVNVLEPAPEPTGPSRPALPMVMFDAATADAPDLPDPPTTPTDRNPCGCEGAQLCSAGGCVNPAGPTMVDAGRMHTCLVADGRLHCFGDNQHGQLGVGDQDNRYQVTRVGSDNDWLRVSGGERHTCGLRAPGQLYCWGDNAKGQLGLGDTRARLAPARSGERDDWERVSCGGDNCCAMRDGGRLYCWGDNLEGKPGQGDPFGEPDVLEPREVPGGPRFAEVALGQGHVNAITVDGALLGWGRNPSGEAGIGTEQPQPRAPLPTATDEGSVWISVAAAQHHSCAVREDGTLHCWGSSPFGELGTGVVDETFIERAPVQEGTGASDWVSVAAGWFHSCGVKADDTMHCWGRAIEGQLGQGGGEPVPKPTAVEGEQRWRRPVLGGFHTCAFDDRNALHCWGMNEGGQIGQPDMERRHTPALVELD